MPTHKTSAWLLAQVYLGLIVYASLYPFVHWRYQGVAPWVFMLAPWPKYWTGFDVVSNVLGYMPLGFLLALSALRTGRGRWAILAALLACALLSFAMESLQMFLPDRVPSNVDLGLNVMGAMLGAVMAWSLEKLGLLQRWGRFRANWFVADARGALVLLALWPIALLFPTAVPFGLGHVLERIEGALVDVLDNSPFLEWLPVRDVALQPLLPTVEWLCVMLGVMVPGLLGYCIIRRTYRRVWFLVWLLAIGVGASALSGAMSFGPAHAWAWLTPSVEKASLAGLGALCALLWLRQRAAAAIGVLALGVYLSLINQTFTSPYLEQTLFMWEQGRFIRFNGLAQWLGWLWPFATLVYLLSVLWSKESKN